MAGGEIGVMLEMIDQAYDHESWHGTNLRGSVSRVTAEEAAWRPAAERHNIHELVVHAAYWKYVVRRRLTGEKRGSFPRKGSNWFDRPSEASVDLWKEDVALLGDTHASLRAVIAELAPRDLDRVTPGAKTMTRKLITGIAAHDLYHAGQIQLLKRLMRE